MIRSRIVSVAFLIATIFVTNVSADVKRLLTAREISELKRLCSSYMGQPIDRADFGKLWPYGSMVPQHLVVFPDKPGGKLGTKESHTYPMAEMCHKGICNDSLTLRGGIEFQCTYTKQIIGVRLLRGREVLLALGRNSTLLSDYWSRPTPRDQQLFDAGIAAHQKRKYRQAVLKFTAAIAVSKDRELLFLLYQQRARDRVNLKDFEAAIPDCERAIQIDPKHSDAPYLVCGKALLNLRRYREAINVYQRGVKLMPDGEPLHSALAWVYATCPDSSIRDGRKAVSEADTAHKLWTKYDPHRFDPPQLGFYQVFCLEAVAATAAEVGDFKKAIATIRLALRSDSNSPEDIRILQRQLSSYEERKPYREILNCTLGYPPA